MHAAKPAGQVPVKIPDSAGRVICDGRCDIALHSFASQPWKSRDKLGLAREGLLSQNVHFPHAGKKPETRCISFFVRLKLRRGRLITQAPAHNAHTVLRTVLQPERL